MKTVAVPLFLFTAFAGCGPSGAIHKTVASGEKAFPYGVIRHYGYEIQSLSLPVGLRVRLWGETLSIQLDAPGLKFQKVIDQRWIAEDRVLYLSILSTYTDSGVTDQVPVRVLYDFERGELYSYCPASSWMLWSPEHRKTRKTTEEEFEAILKSFKQNNR